MFAAHAPHKLDHISGGTTSWTNTKEKFTQTCTPRTKNMARGKHGPSNVIFTALCILGFCKALQPTYNCSLSYSLKFSGEVVQAVGGSNQFCWDSCLLSSPATPVEGDLGVNCLLLLDIFQSHSGLIAANDCLELILSPGDYRLSSLSLVQVQYSVVLRAPAGGVTFSCGVNSERMCRGDGNNDGGGTTSPPGDTGREVAMVAFDGSQLNDMFVALDSISFQYCSKKLQFDALEELRIINSSFM